MVQVRNGKGSKLGVGDGERSLWSEPFRASTRRADRRPQERERLQRARVFLLLGSDPALQLQFVEEMGVDADKVGAVASQFSHLSGYALPLAT